jgi:hypothetical protein
MQKRDALLSAPLSNPNPGSQRALIEPVMGPEKPTPVLEKLTTSDKAAIVVERRRHVVR